MGFKMMGGKSPKAKTGNGVPGSLMGGPKMHGDSHTDPVDAKKAKAKPKAKPEKNLTREEQVQKRYPGAVKRKGTINDYDYKGTTLTPGVKKKKVLSDKEKIIKAINSKK